MEINSEISNPEPVLLDVESLEVEQRFAVANEWLAASSRVAQLSGLPAAEEVANFLATRTALGIAYPAGGVLRLHSQEPELDVSQYAFLTPLLDIDCERLTDRADWRRAMAEGQVSPFVAQFMETSRAIYFSATVTVSEIGKGLIMLHEAVHAMIEIDGSADRSVPNQYWAEEAKAYRLEYQIMVALGGKAYKELVERVADTISGAEEDDNGRIKVPYSFSETERGVIRQIFNSRATDDEISLWTKLAFDNAWLLYFERYYDQPMEEFANFLSLRHGQKSIQPDAD